MLDDVELERRVLGADAEAPEMAGSPGLPMVAAWMASAALAACGGRDDDAGNGTTPPASGGQPSGDNEPLSPLNPATGANAVPKTDAEAARFLLQAQFSASEADIAAVRSKGYRVWLGEKLTASKVQTGWDWVAGQAYRAVNVDDMIWSQLMASDDPVRKRMALALSEIFVVSATDIPTNWPDLMMSHYWDILVEGVTGNFRDLLEAISLNPAMGCYLNTRGNKKENAQGRQPDENYAREVMQLMTIGLYQLESDGSLKKAVDGSPVPTYTQSDISNLARVFTGYDLDIRSSEVKAVTRQTSNGASQVVESPDWTARPMALQASGHSMLEASFLGVTVPANTDGAAALKIALDTLFQHPNVGPFIGRQLIQRLVTSNPSPAYVARVATVFANNGAGVRGDMKSVFAAVLLDDEARGPQGLTSPNHGRLREPVVRLVQWARTFGTTSATGTWKVGNLSDSASQLGQSPLRSPSVFNFFRPGYVPPSTAMAAAGQVAPEFQIVNEISVAGYLNFMQSALVNGFNKKDVQASYSVEKTLVLDPAALVQRLNLLLCANQLSDATQTLIASALATPALTDASTDTLKLNRIAAALLLVMASSEYLIQK